MTAHRFTAEGTIVSARRLQHSVNGNPRYSVTIQTDEGARITARTSPDSSLAYRYTFTLLEGRRIKMTYSSSRILQDAQVLDGEPA